MRLLFITLFILTTSQAFSADSSNVLAVDITFFIQLGIFIFIILFLNKFLFQPLLNLKDDRDIETFVKIERAKNIEEDSDELSSEYKIIKEAEKDSIEKIKEARENLNSEVLDSIKNLTIDDIKISNDDISIKIKELSKVIKSKIN